MSEQTVASIAVGASPRAVMAVIEDLAAYPLWNEEIREVEIRELGPDGRPVTARFVLDSSAFQDDYALRYSWEGDTSARWTLTGDARILSKLDGAYSLRETAPGTTEVTYTLAVDVKVPMIGMLKRKAEKVLIERALRGLRARVEEPPT